MYMETVAGHRIACTLQLMVSFIFGHSVFKSTRELHEDSRRLQHGVHTAASDALSICLIGPDWTNFIIDTYRVEFGIVLLVNGRNDILVTSKVAGRGHDHESC